jgi:hypothetical protein
MSNFSGAIKLADLSDFIAPSQACVVKLDGNKVTLDAGDIAEVLFSSQLTTAMSFMHICYKLVVFQRRKGFCLQFVIEF